MQACYGILKVPEGSWLCRTCALGVQPKCLLCPKKGGAMKPTRSGTKWVHVSCALWIPEVGVVLPELRPGGPPGLAGVGAGSGSEIGQVVADEERDAFLSATCYSPYPEPPAHLHHVWGCEFVQMLPGSSSKWDGVRTSDVPHSQPSHWGQRSQQTCSCTAVPGGLPSTGRGAWRAVHLTPPRLGSPCSGSCFCDFY